jgi:hypothetical protein
MIRNKEKLWPYRFFVFLSRLHIREIRHLASPSPSASISTAAKQADFREFRYNELL